MSVSQTPPAAPRTLLTQPLDPTVSKIPPTKDEVAGFITLVDTIRATHSNDPSAVIACHWHYGFNRTGFFVCSYLIARLGYTVQEAVDAFKIARPPGILETVGSKGWVSKVRGAAGGV